MPRFRAGFTERSSPGSGGRRRARATCVESPKSCAEVGFIDYSETIIYSHDRATKSKLPKQGFFEPSIFLRRGGTALRGFRSCARPSGGAFANVISGSSGLPAMRWGRRFAEAISGPFELYAYGQTQIDRLANPGKCLAQLPPLVDSKKEGPELISRHPYTWPPARLHSETELARRSSSVVAGRGKEGGRTARRGGRKRSSKLSNLEDHPSLMTPAASAGRGFCPFDSRAPPQIPITASPTRTVWVLRK